MRSLRGYFVGVTIVATFNGLVVGIGALILGVPLAGTIAIVTVVTAYIPYIGAFVAGAFAVVVALGANGTTTAVIMLVIVILANGLLQNIVQPFAMGSALDLHPLVVLVATIASGCIFGIIGLILAAPLLSAAVHITRDLARARGQPPGARTRGHRLPAPRRRRQPRARPASGPRRRRACAATTEQDGTQDWERSSRSRSGSCSSAGVAAKVRGRRSTRRGPRGGIGAHRLLRCSSS